MIKTYIRRATKDFTCSCCKRTIKKGTEYRDEETVINHDDSSVTIKHKRKHLNEQPFKLNYPEICIDNDGSKINVLGIVFTPMPKFLVREWPEGKYYFRQYVLDMYGNTRLVEDEVKEYKL